jgi:hypothetical protein
MISIHFPRAPKTSQVSSTGRARALQFKRLEAAYRQMFLQTEPHKSRNLQESKPWLISLGPGTVRTRRPPGRAGPRIGSAQCFKADDAGEHVATAAVKPRRPLHLIVIPTLLAEFACNFKPRQQI